MAIIRFRMFLGFVLVVRKNNHETNVFYLMLALATTCGGSVFMLAVAPLQ